MMTKLISTSIHGMPREANSNHNEKNSSENKRKEEKTNILTLINKLGSDTPQYCRDPRRNSKQSLTHQCLPKMESSLKREAGAANLAFNSLYRI